MKNYSKSDKKIIHLLKDNKNEIYYYEIKNLVIGMLLIERGERLFFQLNNKALLCMASARYAKILSDSIFLWDSGELIEIVEKKKIIELIKEYYRKSYKDDLEVVSLNDDTR